MKELNVTDPCMIQGSGRETKGREGLVCVRAEAKATSLLDHNPI